MITKEEIENLDGWKLWGAAANGGTLLFAKDKKYTLRFNGNNFIYKEDNDLRLTEIQIELVVLVYDETKKSKVNLTTLELYRGHPKNIDELKNILRLLQI